LPAPVRRLHWEKNRFIYDLMYKKKVMKQPLFEWLTRHKIADGALISKWRKPGYELLCSTLAIQKGNHNFGGVAHCRVPLKQRASAQRITPNVNTGCISCASGDGLYGGPIWWNTQLEEEGDKEGGEGAAGQTNRAVWVQPGAAAGHPGMRAAGAKRGREEGDDEEEDEMPEEVKRRLAALKGES